MPSWIPIIVAYLQEEEAAEKNNWTTTLRRFVAVKKPAPSKKLIAVEFAFVEQC